MSTFKWISEGIKSLRISKSIIGNQDVQARFLGSSVAEPVPPRPKRPLSPFLKYSLAARNEVKKQHPELKPGEVIRVLAQKWHQLPETQKEPYSKNFETEMTNYVKEMAKYKSSLTPEQVQQQQQLILEKSLKRQRSEMKQKLVVLKKPKRPSNAFMQYLRDNIPKGTGPDVFKDAVRQLAQKWKTLPEEQKEPYVKKYQAEKEAYEKLLAKWEQRMMQLGQQDVVRQDTLVAAAGKKRSK